MGRRREGPRVDPATIAGVVAPVGWRRAGSSSPHLRAFAIGLARRPSAQRRVRARFVVEAGISLRKFLWDNDLATRYGLRVSHGVSEGCKSRYPLGLWEKHAETERSLRDYAEAARWYRLAAEQGLAEAQDALEAALARVAVEQGSADLQFFLGLTRWRGEGPNGEVALKDPEEAVRWFRMAAEQGHAEAQYNLGLAYHEWGRRLRG